MAERLGWERPVTDPRMEDHAVGVELQINELVEKRERALVQGRSERATLLQQEIEVLQTELAVTADKVADEDFGPPDFTEEPVT